MSNAAREVRDRLPSWYRGDVHLVLHFLVIGGLTAATGAGLAVMRPALLPAVVLLLPAWSLVEYTIHRWLLHGARTWWPAISRDHLTHHAYFPADDMFYASHRDMYRVLQRPQDVLALELLAAVFTGAGALVAGPAVALAVATSANLHFLLYEVLHACAHSERLARHPLARAIARHHRAHHVDVVEARRNFATVFPVTDSLFGTTTAATREPRERGSGR